SDPERSALLIEARSAALFDLARDDEAQRELERAAALLPEDAHSSAHAVVLSSLAASLVITGDFSGARPVAEQAIAAASDAGAPEREAVAHMMLGMALGYLGETDRSVAELEASVELAR